MKCIKKGKIIKRVSNEEAYVAVQQGWDYTNKQEWREKVRDAKPPKAEKKEKSSE